MSIRATRTGCRYSGAAASFAAWTSEAIHAACGHSYSAYVEEVGARHIAYLVATRLRDSKLLAADGMFELLEERDLARR
jgi:hypothetical protein